MNKSKEILSFILHANAERIAYLLLWGTSFTRDMSLDIVWCLGVWGFRFGRRLAILLLLRLDSEFGAWACLWECDVQGGQSSLLVLVLTQGLS